jgi:hypothetical protein
VRGRLLLGALVVALLLAAMAVGGVGSSRSDGASSGPCHVQVNCAGQVANAPLGSSALPTAAVVVVAVLVLVSRLDLTPSGWRDRLVGGRLFRPPRLLG